MYARMTLVGIPGLLAVALLAAGCGDAVSPARHGLRAPQVAAAAPGGTGIVLDQEHGVFGQSGLHIADGFNPTNPHLGDAIIATFFWLGSTNTITTVTDHLCDGKPSPSGWPGTPVGNTYTLLEYVTLGGISMATYVATNVQNYPDPNPDQNTVLCVHAIFASPVTDAGVMLSAYSGVSAVSAQALGGYQSASGSGSSLTTADPGAIPVGAGALAYGVTMSNDLVGVAPPPAFTNLATLSDAAIVADGEYAVQGAGSVDPQWTWYFTQQNPGTWLATVVALNPPLHLVFTVQPSTTLPLATIRPAVTVTAVDALGNSVASFTGAVTVAIGHNGGLLMPGTLSGTKTATAVNGVATFSDLSIDQLGNGYTLTTTASGLTGAESVPFNIGAF